MAVEQDPGGDQPAARSSLPIRPLTAPTKADAAYAELRARILDGSLDPGCSLNQEVLAPAMGISVTPLREALRRLEGEGLVEMKSTKAALVVPLTAVELRDLRVVRLSLDPLAASLAAENSDEAGAHQLLRLADVAQMAEVEGWANAHYEFHQWIWILSGNVVLADTLRNLWSRMDRYRLLAMSDRAFDHTSGIEHVRIAQAIRLQNAQLARSMAAAHLEAFQEKDLSHNADT